MNQGIVHGLEAITQVTFLMHDRENVIVDYVIDTGFAGALTLSSTMVAEIGLEFFNEIDANLANGEEVRTAVHVARILLDGKELKVAVLSIGERPLLGTALLEGRRICAEFIEGGKVTIESLD